MKNLIDYIKEIDYKVLEFEAFHFYNQKLSHTPRDVTSIDRYYEIRDTLSRAERPKLKEQVFYLDGHEIKSTIFSNRYNFDYISFKDGKVEEYIKNKIFYTKAPSCNCKLTEETLEKFYRQIIATAHNPADLSITKYSKFIKDVLNKTAWYDAKNHQVLTTTVEPAGFSYSEEQLKMIPEDLITLQVLNKIAITRYGYDNGRLFVQYKISPDFSRQELYK